MTILDKLKIVAPFSYMWILRRSIGDVETILDLGCGDGRLMEVLSQNKNWKISGVDIFPRYLKAAKERRIYKNLITGDIHKNVKRLIRKKIKYDVVFFSQVIEHMSKAEGIKVLDILDKLAIKKIIVGTPKGFMHQPKEFLDSNPHQVHKSGWTKWDFIHRGYKVNGIGIKPVWSEEGLARTNNKFMLVFWTLVAYLVSIPVYFLPDLGTGILAVKNIEKQ